MGWALWDLSGHVSDQDTARRALHLAAEFLADVPKRDWRAAFASLRILTALARSDAERGDIPPFRLTIRQYARIVRSEEHTSELKSLMRISYAVFCLNKKNITINIEQSH